MSIAPNPQLARRLLDALADDILPLTEKAVAEGNKIFGAALLKKDNYSTYLAETNNEIDSPLHHGEMHLLKRYYEIPTTERLPVEDLLFLSTHEPCSMCLSAITWSGFDNFFYFFSHEDSRDAFAIPHDLNILREVFALEPGQYARKNAFWQCHSIVEWITELTDEETRQALMQSVTEIKQRYDLLSATYQADKSENDIPLN